MAKAPLTITPETLPWYRSQIIVAMVVSILTKVLVISGLIGDVTTEDQEQVTNLIVLIAGGLADLWAVKSRIVQTSAPTITATKQTP